MAELQKAGARIQYTSGATRLITETVETFEAMMEDISKHEIGDGRVFVRMTGQKGEAIFANLDLIEEVISAP